MSLCRQSSQKRRSGTPVHGTDNDSHEEEVHTLRREKKALKDELEETKAKQLNFEAAFKTEFDLRTTIEEKYDSLRERYEVITVYTAKLKVLWSNICIPRKQITSHVFVCSSIILKICPWVI